MPARRDDIARHSVIGYTHAEPTEAACLEDPRLGPWGNALALTVLPLGYAALTGTVAPSVVLAVAALWLLGRAAGTLVPGLLAQTAPLLPPILPDPIATAAAALAVAALLPLTRDHAPRDHHAGLTGLAVALGMAVYPGFAALALLPALLFDRRRFIVHGAAVVIGGALALAVPLAVAAPTGSWLLLAALAPPVAVVLAAYVRMRRRGLMQRDRRARLLAAMAAAQLLVVALSGGRSLMPALLLGGPMLALLWPMTRPLAAPRTHRRLWLAALAGLAVVRLLHWG